MQLPTVFMLVVILVLLPKAAETVTGILERLFKSSVELVRAIIWLLKLPCVLATWPVKAFAETWAVQAPVREEDTRAYIEPWRTKLRFIRLLK